MLYAIIDEDNRALSVIEMESGNSMIYEMPDDRWRVVVIDGSMEIFQHDFIDYRYDEETKEFIYDPKEYPPATVDVVDLSTGETVTMTSEDIDAMVDEKVRNQVEAVISELMSEAAKKEEASPKLELTNVGSILNA